MQRILTTINLAEEVDSILWKTKELVDAFDAHLCILHAEPDGDVYARKEDNQEHQEQMFHKIDKIRQKFQEFKIFPNFTEAGGDPLKCIVNECKRFRPDVLIMGANRHGKVYRMINDSLRDALVEKVKCSILLVHPDDKLEKFY
ncbi:MAG: universal stress protein [Lentisphaeraceae bacterium]|nr:universal stress protein [Lentisphaeraceae bacterium]